MKYIMFLIVLLFSQSAAARLTEVTADNCKEECGKLQDSCNKFATKVPAYGTPGVCQARYNRCFILCRKIAPFIAQKANQRKNSQAARTRIPY